MDTLPEGTEVDSLGGLIMGGFAAERQNLDPEFRDMQEYRTLSTVERDVVKHERLCKLCEANNDPANVPVHPGCHCDIRTLEVQTGVADPSHPLLSIVSRESGNLEGAAGVVLPDGVLLDPASVAILNPDEMRYEDLLVWLDQMQNLLEKADYVAMAIDDGQETIEQVGAALEASADVLSRRTWLAIAKAVVL